MNFANAKRIWPGLIFATLLVGAGGCQKPTEQKARAKWPALDLTLRSEGIESLQLKFSEGQGVARDGRGKPIATLFKKGERLLIADLNRSPFCSIDKKADKIVVFKGDQKVLLSLRPDAQGLSLATDTENRSMKHLPNGGCSVVGTTIQGNRFDDNIDVEQGASPLFSARGASCFAALTLSLNELPFMDRLCVFVAAENAQSL